MDLLLSGFKACDLLLGGQQRISGRRGCRRCWVGGSKVGEEYGFGEVGSSGFLEVECKVVLGEMSEPGFKLFKYWFSLDLL